MRAGGGLLLLLCLARIASADLARAEEPAAGGVELDRLLRLPSSMDFDHEQRKGADATAWRGRFREIRQELAAAEHDLEKARGELDQVAATGGGQWQVAPPGANQTETSPMSPKLREDIRRNRERVEEARRKQRELEIEADLAGVPEAWRHDEP